MTYVDIIKNINCLSSSGDTTKTFHGKIRLDSTLVTTGDIFVAVKGKKVDGHDYIEDAIRRGAECVIVQKEVVVPENVVFIMVPSTIDCLLELAKLIRLQYKNIPLIAITGSVGKTTTKELIYSMLSTKYKVLKNEGNQNNHIGVPLTLFELDDSFDICVLELGMNHEGEIDKLSRACLPTDCVITNIGTSHIGNLGSKKNIFKAKMEILNGMTNGMLFINGDDKYLKTIKKQDFQLVTCGRNRRNDIRATNILCAPNHLYFNAYIVKQKHPMIFSIANAGLISNLLLAIGVAHKYHIDINHIASVLEQYQSTSSRMQLISLGEDILLIDDAYNASFESLKNGLDFIEQYDKKKIVILGDILELGEHSKMIHQKIKKLLKNYEKTILIGKEVKYIWNKDYIYCKDILEAKNYLDTLPLEGRLIYLKGSHSMNLQKLAKQIIEEHTKKSIT